MEIELYEFSFAADEPKVVLDEINKSNKAGLITFIPDEWVCKFKENGFDIFAIWNDYFNQDISKYIVDDKIEKLLNQVISYGVKHGAKKSYLMADECNNNAIHLYRKIGFYSDKIEHEITMIKDK